MAPINAKIADNPQVLRDFVAKVMAVGRIFGLFQEPPFGGMLLNAIAYISCSWGEADTWRR